MVYPTVSCPSRYLISQSSPLCVITIFVVLYFRGRWTSGTGHTDTAIRTQRTTGGIRGWKLGWWRVSRERSASRAGILIAKDDSLIVLYAGACVNGHLTRQNSWTGMALSSTTNIVRYCVYFCLHESLSERQTKTTNDRRQRKESWYPI